MVHQVPSCPSLGQHDSVARNTLSYISSKDPGYIYSEAEWSTGRARQVGRRWRSVCPTSGGDSNRRWPCSSSRAHRPRFEPTRFKSNQCIVRVRVCVRVRVRVWIHAETAVTQRHQRNSRFGQFSALLPSGVTRKSPMAELLGPSSERRCRNGLFWSAFEIVTKILSLDRYGELVRIEFCRLEDTFTNFFFYCPFKSASVSNWIEMCELREWIYGKLYRIKNLMN